MPQKKPKTIFNENPVLYTKINAKNIRDGNLPFLNLNNCTNVHFNLTIEKKKASKIVRLLVYYAE